MNVAKQEEIANKKGSNEPLTWDDLAKMKYTWRVATETLRMTPLIFCSFRRALQDVEFGGYVIPEAWQVIWALGTTHMDENIFPNPSKFDPMRYEQATPPPFSFVTFGGGPRMCPGYEFSKLETLAPIHYLVTRSRWKFSIADNSFSRDPMPVFNQGLPIQIEEKKKQFDI
ncbi:Cytochrome P450 [Dillenia turbinata]|uniref:Cytochrome P450 n=1 Tax=Dillenia turbinata TaxID=194707 RepID=A0AAN8VMA8_9MAGN